MRGALNRVETAEAVVIGAGVLGAATAMELARRGSLVSASVRGVAAEHRLRFCRTRQGEEQKKKR